MRKPYLVRKAESEQRAREWYAENVEKRSENERRLENMRDQVESKETAAPSA